VTISGGKNEMPVFLHEQCDQIADQGIVVSDQYHRPVHYRRLRVRGGMSAEIAGHTVSSSADGTLEIALRFCFWSPCMRPPAPKIR
jgi:hypothetical protein